MFHSGPSLWLGDVQQSCPIFLILTGVRTRIFTRGGFKLLFCTLLRNCQPDLKTVECAHHIQKKSRSQAAKDNPALCWHGTRGQQTHRHHAGGFIAFTALHRWAPLQQYISHSRLLSSRTEKNEASLLFTGRSEGV